MWSNPHLLSLLRVRFLIATMLKLRLMPAALWPLLLVLQPPMTAATLWQLDSRQKVAPPQRLPDNSL
jgi:hypothetical protein